jgi:hypothetical protein
MTIGGISAYLPSGSVPWLVVSYMHHVHAWAAEHRAVVGISTGIVTVGSLTARQAGLVRDWVELHRAELLEAWQRASRGDPPGTIDPLP